MKKIIISVIMLAGICLSAQAQNDTTKVNVSNPRWEKVVYKTSDPAKKDKVEYSVVVNGREYSTNKTSYERYALIKRHGGEPCVVVITTKTGAQRIAVL